MIWKINKKVKNLHTLYAFLESFLKNLKIVAYTFILAYFFKLLSIFYSDIYFILSNSINFNNNINFQ